MADTYKFESNSSGSTEETKETSAETEGSATTDTSRLRRYSSEEVTDIIRISLQNESGNMANTIDHDELIAIGKEVGVSGEQIDRAVHLFEGEQKAKDKENELWLKFKAHVAVFVGVNLLCIIINLLTGIEYFWAAYVLLGMGLFLLGHYAGLRYAPEFVQMAMDRTKDYAHSRYQATSEEEANVAFTVADASGLMATQGLLFIDDDSLVIEHQTIDGVLGMLKTSIKETKIPLREITLAKLEQNLWSSEFVLQTRSPRTLRNIPGRFSGILRLKINRQSNNAASFLLKEINSKKLQESEA